MLVNAFNMFSKIRKYTPVSYIGDGVGSENSE